MADFVAAIDQAYEDTLHDLRPVQIQADTLGFEVSKPGVGETTALGVADVAGLATGFWASKDELRENWREGQRWSLKISEEERAAGYAGWKKAVQRTLDRVQV